MKKQAVTTMLMILGVSAAGMPYRAHASFANGTPIETSGYQGTGPRSQQTMVYLLLGNGQFLIMSPDQLLMTAGGRLQRADRLTPDTLLVDRDGRSVEIKEVSIGEYQGGVHHIERSGAVIGTAEYDY